MARQRLLHGVAAPARMIYRLIAFAFMQIRITNFNLIGDVRLSIGNATRSCQEHELCCIRRQLRRMFYNHSCIDAWTLLHVFQAWCHVRFHMRNNYALWKSTVPPPPMAPDFAHYFTSDAATTTSSLFTTFSSV